ncbi:MAG: hypothetical protein EAZ85_10470 [Bacteroidetes bacterium]|nr:MAG: hypothetical protein EAZ85_10470 [Bacteroidota bacterium]TAG86483.1 MAG: hypothetical protein EAZ20_12685 [Bacteroidota bacterium]
MLEDLKKLNNEANKKALSDNIDSFVSSNINFFTKSFMITLCAYLESYLKDISMEIIDAMNARLYSAKLPYNLVKWSILKKKELADLNDNELKFEQLTLNITKKELDSFISGMPYRTENLFKKFGIRLFDDEIYNHQKEKIISIVVKRNEILHYNDTASDLSFTDVSNNIDYVTEYIENLDKIVIIFINTPSGLSL